MKTIIGNGAAMDAVFEESEGLLIGIWPPMNTDGKPFGDITRTA